ncbi:hypothetical protein ACMX2H_15935 [Arthrobacter sulfonylureivorans]|uniref:hypothetical protein n=1 Tax=Arthrobacter sulfonylureivorans TaxID=2486855 RepID=UPI0039E302D7
MSGGVFLCPACNAACGSAEAAKACYTGHEGEERPTDLQWLLSLGVDVGEAARRIGRTPTAVQVELARSNNGD